MIIGDYKKFSSHKEVVVGDVIMFQCKSHPKKYPHVRYGDRQLWKVIGFYPHNGVQLKKMNTTKNIEMILHDYRINNHSLQLKTEEELLIFTVYYAKYFTLKDLIFQFFSKFKRKAK